MNTYDKGQTWMGDKVPDHIEVSLLLKKVEYVIESINSRGTPWDVEAYYETGFHIVIRNAEEVFSEHHHLDDDHFLLNHIAAQLSLIDICTLPATKLFQHV